MRTNETQPSPTIERRAALRRLAVGSLAGGSALAMGRELLGATAAGATTGAMQFGDTNDAGSDTTLLTSTHTDTTLEVTNTGSGKAIFAVGGSTGFNQPTITVSNIGTNNAIFAVQATDTTEIPAVHALTWGPGPALVASTLHDDGQGLSASTTNGHCISAHVYGSGRGMHVRSHSAASSAAGVYSDTEGTGAAIDGIGRLGRGGRFRGAKAQVQLVPGAGVTHPVAGLSGDLYVDSTRRLWFCRGGVQWVQLA